MDAIRSLFSGRSDLLPFSSTGKVDSAMVAKTIAVAAVALLMVGTGAALVGTGYGAIPGVLLLGVGTALFLTTLPKIKAIWDHYNKEAAPEGEEPYSELRTGSGDDISEADERVSGSITDIETEDIPDNRVELNQALDDLVRCDEDPFTVAQALVKLDICFQKDQLTQKEQKEIMKDYFKDRKSTQLSEKINRAYYFFNDIALNPPLGYEEKLNALREQYGAYLRNNETVEGRLARMSKNISDSYPFK